MINYILLFIFFNINNDKIKLFNGVDLTGWKIYGTEKWYVENNEMVCESGPDKGYGYLATNKFYDDFIDSFMICVCDPRLDSGLRC